MEYLYWIMWASCVYGEKSKKIFSSDFFLIAGLTGITFGLKSRCLYSFFSFEAFLGQKYF